MAEQREAENKGRNNKRWTNSREEKLGRPARLTGRLGKEGDCTRRLRDREAQASTFGVYIAGLMAVSFSCDTPVVPTVLVPVIGLTSFEW